MRLPKRGSLVRVDWDDAASNDAWSDNQTSISECVTVGWLVAASKRQVRISASQVRHERRYAERIAIPRGSVRSVRRLKVKR